MIFKDVATLLVLLGIAFVVFGLGYLVANNFLKLNENYYEKISSYECGFDAFNDARNPFDIKFYLIAILFIIFDVEVLFFFPWALTIRDLALESFYYMIIFMIILMVGFAYEWKKGCMDWE